MIRIAAPLLFATLGEMFSERAGILNLGIEGIMLLGAMTGFCAAYFSGNLWIGVAAAALTGYHLRCAYGVFDGDAWLEPACFRAQCHHGL